MKRVHVFITGTVQGVFFRDATKEQADRIDVKGWVRNKADGRVEAVFEGADQAVGKMVDWCRRGPGRAIVDDVTVAEEPFEDEFPHFRVVR